MFYLILDSKVVVGPRTSMTHGTALIRPHLQGPWGYWLLLIGVFPARCTFRSRAHPTLLLSSFFKNQLQIQYGFN